MALKGGTASGQLSQNGIRVTSAIYGKTIPLVYGLTLVTPNLIWYSNWVTSGNPFNNDLYTVTGNGQQKKNPGFKKSNTTWYAASVDMVLGHAPILGVLTAYYNNQKFDCAIYGSSGFISDNQFTFIPSGFNSLSSVTTTVPSGSPYTLTVANFVSDVAVNVIGGDFLETAQPLTTPASGQYTASSAGLYTFSAAQAGAQIRIQYREVTTGTAAGILTAIVAVTVNEPYSASFNDYGAPAASTVYGTWDHPLWNTKYAAPGDISSGAFTSNTPYIFNWDGINPLVTVPAALNGLPITVYYAVPQIVNSYGKFFSTTTTPLGLLGLEFETTCGSGSEYYKNPSQQIINNFCAGVGSPTFDLGMANAIPNLNFECQGAFTKWPNGDCDVADIITDIAASGPVLIGSF